MPDPVPNQLSGEAAPNVTAAAGGVQPAGTSPAAPGTEAEPVAGWSALPTPPLAAPKGTGRNVIAALILNPIGIRVLIAVVVLGGGLLLRDFLSRDVNDVRVGDCVDVPSATSSTITELQHHPCDQAHTGEVVSVFDYSPAGATDPFPGVNAFKAQVAATCVTAFASYTGATFEDRADLDMTYLHPTETSWSKGDRELICIAVAIDGAPMTGSIKKR